MHNFLALSAAAASGSGFVSIIYLVLLFGFMWFVLIRPQRKRQKEIDQMQSAIKIGDPVLTNGGLYGKVVDLVNDSLVIELGMNKTIRVPIERRAVAAVKEPNLKLGKEEVQAVADKKEEKKEEKES